MDKAKMTRTLTEALERQEKEWSSGAFAGNRRLMSHEPTPRRLTLFIKQEKKCHWCEVKCHMNHPGNNRQIPADMFTEDHVIPRYRGGTNDADNVVGACHQCNQLRNSIEQKLIAGRSIRHINSDLRTKLAPVHFVVKGKR